MFRKNAQGTVYFTMIDKETGVPLTTGNITARVIRDGSLYTSNTLTPGSNLISGTHVWKYDFATAALNGDAIGLGLTHASGVPQVININTFERTTEEIYDGISTLQAGVTVGAVGSSQVKDISDFHTSTSGLSTFDSASDFVTFASPVDSNVIEVNGVGVTIGDFRAQGITASVSGVVQANIVQVATSGISDISDFYTNTSGLSTFDYTSDFVTVIQNGITAGGLASSAITSIVNGIWNNVVDGSITFETVMEMLLAWMAGKVIVIDNGSTRTIRFMRRDGSTASFQILVDETDSREGQRSNTGTVL